MCTCRKGVDSVSLSEQKFGCNTGDVCSRDTKYTLERHTALGTRRVQQFLER